jgi:hypothetical protein
MTVRCRRSPPESRGWADAVSGSAALAGALSGEPHSPQNFAVVALSAPHFGQPRGSTVPHSEQNFRLPGFSNPQLEQRIELLRSSTAAACLTRRRKEHFVLLREAPGHHALYAIVV